MDDMYETVPSRYGSVSAGSSVNMSTIADDDFDVVEEKKHKQPGAIQAPPEQEWFHGKMTREDAEALLVRKGREGSYLIRESIRQPGDYSLSFRINNGVVKHFRIINDWGDFYMGGRRFHSLIDLIGYYCNSYLAGNLCLQYPLMPEGQIYESGVRKIVVALYDYTAASPDELSFTKGDTMSVLNDDDPNWWWARKKQAGGGKSVVGFIPSTLVKEKAATTTSAPAASPAPSGGSMAGVPPRAHWFHGKISRDAAKVLLMRDGREGSYLLRESENTPGDYSISFRVLGQVKHFKIEKSGRLLMCGGRSFQTVEEVIQRYLREPLSDNKCLEQPLIPAHAQEETYATAQEEYATVESLPDRSSIAHAPGAIKAAPVAAEQQLNRSFTNSATAPPPSVPQRQMQARTSQYDHTGMLVKKSSSKKKWKTLYFALMGAKRRLYFFEAEGAPRPKGIIDLTCCIVADMHETFFGRPNSFQIIHKGLEEQIYYLCANTDEDKMSWMEILRRYCGTAEGQPPHPVRSNDSVLVLKSLLLTVAEAKELTSRLSHPYCIVSLDNVRQARTQIMTRQNPMWSEEFKFEDLAQSFEKFDVIVINKNKFQKDTDVAHCVVNVSKLADCKQHEDWYPLVSVDDDKTQMGSIRLKAKFTNEFILPLSEYSQLKALLTAADLGAVKAIGSVGKERDEVARTLLKIFQTDSRAVEFLCQLNQMEVMSTEDPNTIFRGNSLATKAMDQYMKLTGLPYLHQTIGEHVKKLFESKESCEMDTTRVKGGDVKENLKRLLGHLQGIWDAIQASVEQCPMELRYVFTNLQTAVVDKWGEHIAKYSAVSGFIFLRLFCPAILNPKLFNMMSDHPSEDTKRTLTLVAKSLQNLANLVEFGGKEPYMKDVNEFIQENKSKMKRYIDKLSTMPAYPKFAKVQPINPARELASIQRFVLRNKDELLKHAKESPDPAVEKLIAVAEKLKAREAAYAEEPTYQNISRR